MGQLLFLGFNLQGHNEPVSGGQRGNIHRFSVGVQKQPGYADTMALGGRPPVGISCEHKIYIKIGRAGIFHGESPGSSTFCEYHPARTLSGVGAGPVPHGHIGSPCPGRMGQFGCTCHNQAVAFLGGEPLPLFKRGSEIVEEYAPEGIVGKIGGDIIVGRRKVPDIGAVVPTIHPFVIPPGFEGQVKGLKCPGTVAGKPKGRACMDQAQGGGMVGFHIGIDISGICQSKGTDPGKDKGGIGPGSRPEHFAVGPSRRVNGFGAANIYGQAGKAIFYRTYRHFITGVHSFDHHMDGVGAQPGVFRAVGIPQAKGAGAFLFFKQALDAAFYFFIGGFWGVCLNPQLCKLIKGEQYMGKKA